MAARLLREAAALTTQPTLKKFLETRADAFLTNDYYASDVAWMELDASASSRRSVRTRSTRTSGSTTRPPSNRSSRVRDDAETAKLATFGAELQEIEDHLPIDPTFRNPKLGSLAPIRVVNVVFTAGDGNRGVQTAAYNLPNDERVVKEKGSKRVMLKNVQEAKFSVVLQPIAKVALAGADQPRVAFDAFFTHILMHELMHGLGPHNITVGGSADDRAAGVEGTVQHDRGSEGRHLGLVGAAAPRSIAASFRRAWRDTMYTTFLASDVPIDPLRHHRSARPRHRDAVELPARSGRLRRRRRRDLRRRTRRRCAWRSRS